ncbi:hypothetical protein HDU67_000480 [Dinochytrium kinnereticum]|nr:hypothetical protein HDU67_000480 [Dinochytrium kinnereticum]
MLTFVPARRQGSNGSSTIKSSAGGNAELLNNSNPERYFGLENFGNTCYCNSVLQSLYFCKAFRECVQNYSYPSHASAILPLNSNSDHLQVLPQQSVSRKKSLKASKSSVSLNHIFKSTEPAMPPENAPPNTKPLKDEPAMSSFSPFRRPSTRSSSGPPLLETTETFAKDDDTLFMALQELFVKISSQRKKTGVVAPSQFVAKLKKENELFRSTMHQDAHEFLNYTLNAIAETLLLHKKQTAERARKSGEDLTPPMNEQDQGRDADFKKSLNLPRPASWVHNLFEGFLTNETKCLTCETVTNREEAFLDLSVDIEQHSSVTSCLRNFSTSETLCQKDKFFCDTCRSLQEAEKRMKIKKLPNILAVHLKRFKYQEKLQRYIKLSYRVVFPMELRLFNTSDDAEDSESLYVLSSVIVHIGGGPYHGHYVSVVKSGSSWVLFDDDSVETVEESELQRYYGDHNSPGTAYILFYEKVDLDYGRIINAMKGGGETGSVRSASSGVSDEPGKPGPTEAAAGEARTVK